MERRKPASINVRTDLSLNYLYDIKYSFLRKLSLQVFSVISIRYVQMVSSSSEGFQCYNLQYFCFASSTCCSIAFPHLAHKTASQQLFYRGLPQALTLLFPLLYCGHVLQGQKQTYSILPCHKYQIYRKVSIISIYIVESTDILEQVMCYIVIFISHYTTLNFCNMCPLQTSGCKTSELVIPVKSN